MQYVSAPYKIMIIYSDLEIFFDSHHSFNSANMKLFHYVTQI